MYHPLTRRLTAEYALPVDLEKLKTHLKVEGADEDGYISDLAIAASALWEERVGQAVMEAEYVTVTGRFNGLMGGLRGPVGAVTSVDYVGEDGTEATLASDAYSLSVLRPDAISFPLWNSYRPLYSAAEPVRIYYTAGAATVDEVPPLIRRFIEMTVAHWYENRQEVILGAGGLAQIPMGAQALIDLEREPVL